MKCVLLAVQFVTRVSKSNVLTIKLYVFRVSPDKHLLSLTVYIWYFFRTVPYSPLYNNSGVKYKLWISRVSFFKLYNNSP